MLKTFPLPFRCPFGIAPDSIGTIEYSTFSPYPPCSCPAVLLTVSWFCALTSMPHYGRFFFSGWRACDPLAITTFPPPRRRSYATTFLVGCSGFDKNHFQKRFLIFSVPGLPAVVLCFSHLLIHIHN